MALTLGGLLLTAIVLIVPDTSRIPGVMEHAVESARHTEENVNYPQTPPAGGPHSRRAQPCGAFDEPVSDELAVHSMERGVVWITHQPQLTAAEQQRLSRIATDRPVIVSPYPGLTTKVVASAWGAQLPLGAVDDPRLERFIKRYAEASSAPKADQGCIRPVD